MMFGKDGKKSFPENVSIQMRNKEKYPTFLDLNRKKVSLVLFFCVQNLILICKWEFLSNLTDGIALLETF